MKKIKVKIKATEESSYNIYIGENLLNNVYEIIGKHTNAKKFLVVTNETVYSLYGEKLKSPNTEFVILPDGEIYKNIDVLMRILDKGFEIKLERKDCIIALGGGVIGDMAGFASSIYERGIDYIQIPTTLLAQVDSSVGGKTAINHSSGKNLIGAFYQPKAVISDISTLNTLDLRQFKTGLSEVLKYAFIEKSCGAEEDYNFIEILQNNKQKIYEKDAETLTKIIGICCELKASVVNKDEKEKGLRAILNFGHTFAHAIENITGYTEYTHGEAVSIGMKAIFDIALTENRISHDYYKKALKLICDYELITETKKHFDENIFYEKMLGDKKVSENKINFVIPTTERKAEITNNIDRKLVFEGIKHI